MRWYDYIVCISCAWDMTRGLLEPDWFQGLLGVGMYLVWEQLRLWEKRNGML